MNSTDSTHVEVRTTPKEEVELLVPLGGKIDPAVTDSWLRAVSAGAGPISFELVGRDRTVSVRVAFDAQDASLVTSQLRAFIPTITIRQSEPSLLKLWLDTKGSAVQALEFGLSREFMLPLRELRSNPDPLTPIIGALAQTAAGDLAVIQVLFEEVRYPWAAHALEAVTSPDGKPFFFDAPQITSCAETKFSAPLYAVIIRTLVKTEDVNAADEMIRAVASALNQYGDPDRNALVPLAFDDLEDLTRDILARSTRRSGMLLSLPELTSLVRVPGEHVHSAALLRTLEPEATLPPEVLGDGPIFGEARHRKALVPVRLSDESRMQHTYIVGASGTGKSTLIENLILQDIAMGHGVGVLDPHGDLVDEILGRIPEERASDVVLFDPSDPDWIVGWNILGAHSEIEKELLASDLVAVFRRLSTSWGDQMSAVLGNAVLAFLESTRGGTLTELRKFLLDEAFRTGFLGTVEDDHVVSFWREEFPLLIGKKPQAPILTRLDIFLRSRLVRAAVTEREKPLNFRDVLDSGRIFLAKLPQGAIGEENAALLGSLLVSKFHQVSFSRQNVARESRRPFFLYIDEFHQMATPSMAGLFSGVRKYRLGLTVAHQDLYQLHATAPEVERAALANAYCRVVFRVSDEDARKLERGMGGFTMENLSDLGRGEAVMRVGRREDAFRIGTLPLPDVASDVAESRRVRIRAASMEQYGRPRPLTTRSQPISWAENSSPPVPRTSSQPEVFRPAVALEAQIPVLQPGRGGAIHKYLQGLVKEWAQTHGFRADVEKELTEGGRVDVFLSRDDLSIACEIAGTTTTEREIANLRKCLDARCTHVCAVSLDRGFLSRLATAAPAQFSSAEMQRIHFLSPEELLPFLSAQTVTRETKRVAGYAIEVRHSTGRPTDTDRRRTIAEVMLKSVRRMREKA